MDVDLGWLSLPDNLEKFFDLDLLLRLPLLLGLGERDFAVPVPDFFPEIFES